MRDDPLDAGDHALLAAAAGGVEHLDTDEACPGRDSALGAAARHTGAGNRARDVGAVAMVVVGRRRCADGRRHGGEAVHERDDLPGEIEVAGVDAGVDDGGGEA